MPVPNLLDPRNDVVFRMLFGKPENRELLISLLNAVLAPEVPIVDIEVLSAELPKDSVDAKGIVLDIRARFADGSQVDVEMQSRTRPAGRSRALYYLSRLYSGQLVRGDDYDRLEPCIVVFIYDFVETSSPRLHSKYRMLDCYDHREFSDHFEIHVIELPKLPASPAENHERWVHAWCKFLTASSIVELEELAMADPIFEKAKSALEHLSADPEARRLAEEREIEARFYKIDLRMARDQAIAEGLAEGRAEGVAQGRAEGVAQGRAEGVAQGRAEGVAQGRAEGVAQGRAEGVAQGRAEGVAQGSGEVLLTLLSRKFGEVPLALQHRVAHASVEEIKRWAERVLFESSVDAVFAD
ncbi:MAG: Rpn family recombination-promoting nuclease/putative transposase [Myxococcota bacterium]